MGEALITRRGGGSIDPSNLQIKWTSVCSDNNIQVHGYDATKKYLVVCSSASDGWNPRRSVVDIFYVDKGVITPIGTALDGGSNYSGEMWPDQCCGTLYFNGEYFNFYYDNIAGVPNHTMCVIELP